MPRREIVDMDILILLLFALLGAIIAGFGVWCYMYLWGKGPKEIDKLKSEQEMSRQVFEAYRQIENAFVGAGWKFGTSFDVLPFRLVIIRKLVPGGVLRADFFPEEHHFQIFVSLPLSKVPPEYKDQRVEAGIEAALLKSPQFKVYRVSEYAGTAWTEIAKRVVEAVDTYEKDWNAIRPRIREVNRILVNAAKEKSAFELRLKNEEAAFKARLDENLKKISEMKAEPKPVSEPKPDSEPDADNHETDFDLGDDFK